VVRFGGVLVDGGCCLSAQVAGFGVEIERAYAVGTVLAVELDAVLDALGTVGFHLLNCSRSLGQCPHPMVRRRK